MSMDAYSVVTAHRASNLIYEMALQAPKGVWILPDNVCPAVPLALACAGARIRFVDIDEDTLCLDTKKTTELAQQKDITGIVYVRTFGTDVSAADDLAKLRKALPDITLIDDRCIGVPQTHITETSGAADVILFSTGTGKILDLDGGAYGFLKLIWGSKLGAAHWLRRLLKTYLLCQVRQQKLTTSCLQALILQHRNYPRATFHPHWLGLI